MNHVEKELKQAGKKEKAALLARFFKTGKGQYGEGDIFLGIMVPVQRAIAKKYYENASLEEIEQLLHSRFHECRLTALFILIEKYRGEDEKGKKRIADFYIRNMKYINNWDLVDLSAPNILGDYLLQKNRSMLYKFAKSKHLWTKRIAILSTFTFIRNNDFNDSLKIAALLVNDKHDLMHKAVGWMLREIGKRDQTAEEKFLKKHYNKMPRTMLRYAIERFPEAKRKFYMKK